MADNFAFDLMNKGALGSIGAGDTGGYNNAFTSVASAFGVKLENSNGWVGGSTGFTDKQLLPGGMLGIFASPKKNKVEGFLGEIQETLRKANANSGIAPMGGGGDGEYSHVQAENARRAGGSSLELS